MAAEMSEPWLHWSSPQERSALLQALRETWHASNAHWLEEVLQHAQAPLDPAQLGPAQTADLAQEAAAAATRGNWRQAGLLYRQLLRPAPPLPPEASAHPLRTPGSW